MAKCWRIRPPVGIDKGSSRKRLGHPKQHFTIEVE